MKDPKRTTLERLYRPEFDPMDWEEMRWLQKKMDEKRVKWDGWVAKIYERIFYGLHDRHFFRLAYQRALMPLTSIEENCTVESLDTYTEAFARPDYEDARGELDCGKIRKAAEGFCIRQMELLCPPKQ